LSGAKACLLSGAKTCLSGAEACLPGAEACLLPSADTAEARGARAVCLLSALVL